MLFSPLTYPVERSYRTRWITEIFYISSFVLVILLAILNFALVGYDTVTVFLPNPNVTHYNQWWAPLGLRTKPGECEPANLPMGAPLKTNSSLPLFTYTLINDPILQDTDSQDGPLTQHSYQANPLDGCRAQFMTLSIEKSSRLLKVTTNVQCNLTKDAGPGQTRVFAVTFTRSEETGSRADSILEYLAFQITGLPNGADQASTISSSGPPNNTFLNVLGLLDGLGRDAIQSAQTENEFQILYTSLTLGGYAGSLEDRSVIVWDSAEDERGLLNETRIIYQSSPQVNGNLQIITNNTLDLHYSYSSLTNILVAVRDAIHLDLGYVSPTNIYLNRTAFDYAIKPDDRIQLMWSIILKSNMVSGEDMGCSWAWGCLSTRNTTWAWELTSSGRPPNNLTLPISPKSPIYPSVINMNYLCPQYRRKSWGSLIVSVFIGTFTMYTTIYGLFRWIGPRLDRKLAGARSQSSTRCSSEEPSFADPTLREPRSQILPLNSTSYNLEDKEQEVLYNKQ